MSPATPHRPMPFITRVRIENYKSIAHCDVALGRFTVLLGLNAAGKSNFLDALRFVRDALMDGPDEALAKRGGWAEVLRRVPKPTPSCVIGLEFRLSATASDAKPWVGRYEIVLAPMTAPRAGQPAGAGVRILRESCEMHHIGANDRTNTERFNMPDRAERGRRLRFLELSRRGEDEPFADLFIALTGIFFYSPALSNLRAARPNTPASGALDEDGGDLGPALAALGDQERKRVSQYAGVIVPEVVEVGRTDPSADYIAARINFATGGETEPHVFRAETMSEGTIRAIGLLTALFQHNARDGWIPLIAIEEPELALHPLAAGALYDALTEASEHVQVLATTQSAELFDREEADLSAIRVVAAEHGVTVIGEVDSVSRSIVADGLATTAELLRSNQLRPVVEPQPDRTSSRRLRSEPAESHDRLRRRGRGRDQRAAGPPPAADVRGGNLGRRHPAALPGRPWPTRPAGRPGGRRGGPGPTRTRRPPGRHSGRDRRRRRLPGQPRAFAAREGRSHPLRPPDGRRTGEPGVRGMVLLASAPSLGGRAGLAEHLEVPAGSETRRDCKGWLTHHRRDGVRYRPAWTSRH